MTEEAEKKRDKESIEACMAEHMGSALHPVFVSAYSKGFDAGYETRDAELRGVLERVRGATSKMPDAMKMYILEALTLLNEALEVEK